MKTLRSSDELGGPEWVGLTGCRTGCKVKFVLISHYLRNDITRDNVAGYVMVVFTGLEPVTPTMSR